MIMSVVKDLLQKIEQQIAQAKLHESFDNKWTVLEVKDGVATVVGLQNVAFSEIVVFENDCKWLVLDILKDQVWVLILGWYETIQQWQIVKSTGQVFSIWVGEKFIWRVVNGIWEPIDDAWEIQAVDQFPVERVAPGVMTRQWVDQPLSTWIKAIDTMVPIGRWQRELIIWDRQTGKTTVAIDTILNQKWQDVICVYVAIWQKESKVRRIVEALKEAWAMDYTIVVTSSASDPSVLQYLAPYIGCTLAEYFMYNWRDALIVYDDLSKHAVAYREVSLLLRRPPGREAYPWDVFYLHSKLLERAARVNADYIEKITQGKVKGKTWSLTALPIIETQAGDVSAYIPTNVISITDGQIFLESDLFNSGMRPAINVWLSVSRVWGSAQTSLMKKVAWKLKLSLANYRELAAFSQFASDLDDATLRVLERGKRMVEILKQPVNAPIPFQYQVVLVYAWINGYIDGLTVEQVLPLEALLYNKLQTSYSWLAQLMAEQKKLTDEIEEQIKQLVSEAIEEIRLQTV
jgi:F-type H+/Na+-transporting ATPase subunit alpha